MFYKDSNLLEEIQQKRLKMTEAARINGYTSEETIRYSQELDQLLNEYQKMIVFSRESLTEDHYVYRQMTLVITRPEYNLN